jgi:hypothetical protein|tara:strand:+ start:512 stop:676 length:165 start_codon:yes stop_codon:yes gene_type:complete
MRNSQDFGAFRGSISSNMADGNHFPDKADSQAVLANSGTPMGFYNMSTTQSLKS